MRISLIVLVSILGGIALGVGGTKYELSQVTDEFRIYYQGAERTGTAVIVGPRVEAPDGTHHDFGIMSRDESRQHVFVVKNVGSEPLDIEFQSVSCGQCVFTGFKQQTIMPMEVAEVPVDFATKKPAMEFSEYLEVATNDSEYPVIRFTIAGLVADAIRLSSEELYLENPTSNRTYTASFQILGFLSEELEVTEYSWSNSATAELFDAEFRRLDPGELDMQSPMPVKAALEALVTVKPGLPVGVISQTIRMKVQAEEAIDVEMPIAGSVVGDITVLGGAGFKRDQNLLDLGRVPRAEGASRVLRLSVKGPNRHDIQLRVASVDPAEALTAEIGEGQPINDGAVYLYPLTVQVPQNAPPVVRLGSAQGKLAKIVVETNHAHAENILVYVRFATE